VADAEGRFRIEKVPPGNYTLRLVHPDTNLRERRTIEVQAGKTVACSIDWHKVK
jgi:hypothetical protein